MAAGLQALPYGLSHGLGPQVVALLQLLEVATGVGFCHHCCNPIPHCRCVGTPQLTPPMSWSQFMEQTPGYGATPSSSGATTPSTSQGGMSGYMPLLPGISVWNMPPLEDAISPGPVPILLYQPPARAGRLRSAISMRGIVPQTPQMPTPIHQPPRNPPPSSTSSSKGASTDPLGSLANYRTQGWKDLSHVLRGFYLYNYPSRMEADWEKLRIKFLNHLGQCQDEWKTIKEETPLEYMPYMECQFLALTGVRLKGLSQFTGWIKPDSYYHGVVARKGQLNMCLHLAEVLPPTRPQICPSETQALMQRRVETPTARPHMPSNRGDTTQGARSDAPTPMETGGAGDGHSWADQAEACPEEE